MSEQLGPFESTPGGGLPRGWEAVCPNPALAPVFGLIADGAGGCSLEARGNGRRECFGYVRHTVKLSAGRTYRLSARLRPEGLEDLNRHLVHGVFAEGFNDGVFGYRRTVDGVAGEGTFRGPASDADGEVRLYFRFSAHGAVRWERVSLAEVEPIPPRAVTIACFSGTGTLDDWSDWLDRAGREGADVALLPEVFNGRPVAGPEPLDGPSGQLMSAKAREWRMLVSGSFYERRGDLTYNTAPLFGRTGELIGTYEKNMLFDPELDEGATPGTGFPVFETDIARIGIMICYDSWFPETARLLAYKGAELILFPNAGYFAGLMPARAADNGVCIAVSSLGAIAGVWDAGGVRAGDWPPDPTRYGVSATQAFREYERGRMVVATVDLSWRPSPAWAGGPMRSAPGGRRVRQTLIDPIEPEIAREARRWHAD